MTKDKTKIFKMLRLKKIQDNNYLCQDCKKSFENKTSYLNLHHIDKNKMNNNDNNIMILCNPCHKKMHSLMKKGGNTKISCYDGIIAIPPELHERLKNHAEKNGQKMTWIVKQAIEEWLAKKEAK